MEKKMTYATAIDNAIEGRLTAEVIDRLNDLKVSLAKRNSKGKETKKQTENKGIQSDIVKVLTDKGGRMTATEVMNALPETFSIQKISALLKSLVDNHEVEKTIEKKVSYFSVPQTEEEETEVEGE